ncbi:MAG: MotA/TolQ/ExbB proton channel family protein, partial [Bacteriovoracaceae bacterium]
RSLFKNNALLNQKFSTIFRETQKLGEIQTQCAGLEDSTLKIVFEEGYSELRKLKDISSEVDSEKSKQVLKQHFIDLGVDNLERALDNGISRSQILLEKKMTFLASVGSSAPFIGLLGTVWGIMDSFSAFASGGATIETIAPGLAEALIATAIGLAVAIPAVLYFNHYSSVVQVELEQMKNFKRDFINMVERTLI